MIHPKPGLPIYLNAKSWPNKTKWIPHIAAWQPVYLQDVGDGVLVYLEDSSEFYFACSSVRVYWMVANYYGIDVEQMRKWFHTATRHSQSVPLVINARGIILFAYKGRIPHYKNDSAMGYIGDKYIQSVKTVKEQDSGMDGVKVTLTTGCEIYAPITLDYFQTHMHRAAFFEYYLRAHRIL